MLEEAGVHHEEVRAVLAEPVEVRAEVRPVTSQTLVIRHLVVEARVVVPRHEAHGDPRREGDRDALHLGDLARVARAVHHVATDDGESRREGTRHGDGGFESPRLLLEVLDLGRRADVQPVPPVARQLLGAAPRELRELTELRIRHLDEGERDAHALPALRRGGGAGGGMIPSVHPEAPPGVLEEEEPDRHPRRSEPERGPSAGPGTLVPPGRLQLPDRRQSATDGDTGPGFSLGWRPPWCSLRSAAHRRKRPGSGSVPARPTRSYGPPWSRAAG